MTITKKKELGAFYTPNLVTDALCNWAISNSSDTLLEPSFGGCNFLISSINRLTNLGCINSTESVYGYDIDNDAFKILNEKKISGTNFFHKDFLTSTQKEIPQKVSAALGNPPFLPINKISLDYRLEVLQNIKFRNLKIDKRSSIWIYFIIQSLKFLKKDGKMAWIVPDSIYFTNYGKIFLSEISTLFASVKLLRIKERFFYESGTHEKTSILLCEGFDKGSCSVEVFNYQSLSSTLNDLSKNNFTNFSEKTNNSYTVSQSFELAQLGDIFDIKIGIVIGAAKLLTIKVKDVEKSPYFPDYVYPLVTKGRQLTNLTVNKDILLKDKGAAAYIIDGIKLEKENPELYRQLLESMPLETISNITFQSRPHLFGYDDFRNPDAFLTYYAQKLPRLIENEDKSLNCSNSVHRLYLKEEFQQRNDIVKFIAIQMFCRFLGDETLQIAREYGNNILKYEPSDAVKIPVLIPRESNDLFRKNLKSVFTSMGECINNSRIEEAIQIGTKFIIDLINI